MASARRRWAGAVLLAAGTLCCREKPASLSISLKPMSHYHDLVAGQSQAGYRDGEFYLARFSGPVGLALSADRSRLFVADRYNNRIRSVDLSGGNRVATVVGKPEQGSQDGPFETASFDRPTAVVAVSADRLIVNDEGNSLLRLVDFKGRKVTTLAGNGGRGVADGAAREVPLGGVWNLAYVASENAVYISQPVFRALRRLNLATERIETVLKDDPKIPNPAALAFFSGTLWVADRSGPVFRAVAPKAVPGSPPVLEFEEAGGGHQVLALAGSAGILYALQSDPSAPWVAVARNAPVNLSSVWGKPLETRAQTERAYFNFGPEEPVGFVADPRRDKAFFVSSSSLEKILDVVDYRFDELRESRLPNGKGLMDFDYPERKPAGVRRILMVGDSHVMYLTGEDEVRWGWGFNRMEILPKRLELMLNTAAAMGDAPDKCEVLTDTRVSWEPLAVWPSYEVPDVCRKYDPDLVLLMIPPDTNTFQAYVDRPATPEGLPAERSDSEYLLEPYGEKIKKSPARKLLELCEARGWIRVLSPTGIEVERLRVLASDPETREEALRLLIRPIHKLKEGLRAIGTGKGPRLVICLFPDVERDSNEMERSIWKDLCAREGIEWIDLTDPFLALQETYFPVSDGTHLTANGHQLMAYLLARELARGGRLGAVAVRP